MYSRTSTEVPHCCLSSCPHSTISLVRTYRLVVRKVNTILSLLQNGMFGGMNVASMPAFPHQFPSPPDVKSRRSDTFLSGEVRLSPLPVSISFHPTKESTLLSNMIQDVKLVTLKFKLAPAFALYTVARFHMSPHFQSGANSSELKKHLVVMLKNSVSYMKRVINVSCTY